MQNKAIECGLEENSLIPKKEDKDKKIFDYLQETVIKGNGRPSSAVTQISTPSKMSNSLIRDYDPSGIDDPLRSSFYSTKNGFNQKNSDIAD